MTESSCLTDLLDAIHRGDDAARDRLLARYRPWLHLLACLQIDARLQSKFDASDIAQRTLLEACRGLPNFRGTTEPEFVAWLRRILARVLAHEIRLYAATQERQLDREVSLEQSLAASSQRLADVLVAPGSSASERAIHHEQEIALAQALARLPSDYRAVIVLRDLQGLSHEEIARQLGRSPGAVRMLWVRALSRLRQEMPGTDEP